MSDRSIIRDDSSSLVVWLHGLGDTPDGWYVQHFIFVTHSILLNETFSRSRRFAQCKSFSKKLEKTSFVCPCAVSI